MKPTTENTVTDKALARPWVCDLTQILEGDATLEEAKANAALIVRSVNLHDKLVKTIQGIYDYAKLCKGTDAERIKYLAKQGLDKIAALRAGKGAK
jgi:hypothetical protein